MTYKLFIPPCICNPTHLNHLPPPEKPLRIQISGPIVAIDRLFSKNMWNMVWNPKFPQPTAVHLAKLAHQTIYPEQHISADNMSVRDEYLGWVINKENPRPEFDYYGVTFDHLVPADDLDPETLMINIIELETDEGPFAGGVEYANTLNNFRIDPKDYVGKRILAVPRCCQKRKGTTDRKRINVEVHEREELAYIKDGELHYY